MAVFVDSGILLRALHRSGPFYPEVRSAIRALIGQGTPVFTGLQQFAEFWNVSTRPRANAVCGSKCRTAFECRFVALANASMSG